MSTKEEDWENKFDKKLSRLMALVLQINPQRKGEAKKKGKISSQKDLEDSVCEIVSYAIELERERIVKAVEKIEEYIPVRDDCTHRYQIPLSKKKEWDEFMEIPSDDERSWDVPEWAERIDGMPVKSFKEQVISLITQK